MRKLKDPFQTPQWRYERVIELLSGKAEGLRLRRNDDSHIARARLYYFRRRAATTTAALERVRDEFFDLHVARRIYLSLGQTVSLRTLVEARILAQQTPEQIADSIHAEKEAIEAYERLYFDVRDRIPNQDWIVSQVLSPDSEICYATLQDEQERGASPTKFFVINDPAAPAFMKKQMQGEHQYDSSPIAAQIADSALKIAAYYGGPHVCDYMVTGFVRDAKKLVDSPEQVGEWVLEQFNRVVFKRTLEGVARMQLTGFHAEQLFNMAIKLQEFNRLLGNSSGSSKQAASYMLENFQKALTDTPISFGNTDRAKFLYEGSKISEYDSGRVELRAADLDAAAIYDGDHELDSDYQESAFAQAEERREKEKA